MDINTEYGAGVQESISLAGWEQRLRRLKRHTAGQTAAGIEFMGELSID